MGFPIIFRRPRHDFRRHPAMAELSDPNGRFIVALEKDLKEEMSPGPDAAGWSPLGEWLMTGGYTML